VNARAVVTLGSLLLLASLAIVAVGLYVVFTAK